MLSISLIIHCCFILYSLNVESAKVRDIQVAYNAITNVSDQVLTHLRETGKRIPESAIRIFTEEIHSDINRYV